jgi:hypothetical protein
MARFTSVNRLAGGARVGTLTCSYADLVKVFGPPGNCDGDKTSTEWCIKDAKTGQLIAVYDYQEVDASDTDEVDEFRARDQYDWHLSCATWPDIEALTQFVKERAAL